MRRFRTWLVLAVVVAAAAQLFRPERTNPPHNQEIQASQEVADLLRRSCYDCHSNRTEWPWYSNVVPVSWFVARHVEKARADLNLTEWPVFDLEAQRFFLSNMKKQIKQEKMPLPSYLLVHRDAQLSTAERTTIMVWIDDELAALPQF